MCGKKGESVQHITSRCQNLAQKEFYKRQHNNVAKKVHGDICKKNRLEHSEKWYEHVRSRECRDQSTVGHKYPMGQSDREKNT